MRNVRSILLLVAVAAVGLAVAGCCCPPQVCRTQHTSPVLSIDPCYWWDPGPAGPSTCGDPLR